MRAEIHLPRGVRKLISLAFGEETKKTLPQSLPEALTSSDFRGRLRGNRPFAILDRKVAIRPRQTGFPQVSFVDLEGPEKRPEVWDDELMEHREIRDYGRAILAVVSKKADEGLIKPNEDDLLRLPRLRETQITKNGTFLVLYNFSAATNEARLLFIKEKSKPFHLGSDDEMRILRLLNQLSKAKDEQKVLEILGEDYEAAYFGIPADTLTFTNEQLARILRLA